MFNVNVEINNEYALEELLWGQGLKTFRYIIADGLIEELMMHLEFMFGEYSHDITEINNYLAYELSEEEFVAKHRRDTK